MQKTAFSALLAGSLALASSLAAAQQGNMTGNAPFCLKSGAQANCIYQTMAQCEQAKPSGSTNSCVDRSQATSTTGQGGGMSPSGSSPSGSSPSGSMSR